MDREKLDYSQAGKVSILVAGVSGASGCAAARPTDECRTRISANDHTTSDTAAGSGDFAAGLLRRLRPGHQARGAAQLKGQPPHSYLGDTLRLQYAENPGAFLGLGQHMPAAARWVVLVVVNTLIASVLAATIALHSRMVWWRVAASRYCCRARWAT